MLMETVRDVYSARQVYQRMLWNCDNVYEGQQQGRPPTATFGQASFLLWFTAGTLLNVLVGLGVKARERREFWTFVVAVVKLRLRGRVASVLEIVLRVTPNAHHLITWGERLREDYERMRRCSSRNRATSSNVAARGAASEKCATSASSGEKTTIGFRYLTASDTSDAVPAPPGNATIASHERTLM
jgi:hypothetical protein